MSDATTRLERLLDQQPPKHEDLIHRIAVSLASFIAAIDSDSNAVAEYIERRLMPLAACARVDLRTLDALRVIAGPCSGPPSALSAARAVDVDRVRSVVREVVKADRIAASDSVADRIAARAAEQLAGAGGGLSAGTVATSGLTDEERQAFLRCRLSGPKSYRDVARTALDRLLASPPVDPPAPGVMDVYAVTNYHTPAVSIEACNINLTSSRACERGTKGCLTRHDAMAAAICALLDSDMPAGNLRQAMAELVGRR